MALFAEDLSRRRFCSNVDETTVLPITQTVSSLRLEHTDYVSVVKNTGSKSDLSSTKLSNVFRIGEGLAFKTISAVTRMCPRNTSDITLNRRYSTNDRMLRYLRMRQDRFMDSMFANKPDGKSARGFTCAQVFATEFGWAYPVLMTFFTDRLMS